VRVDGTPTPDVVQADMRRKLGLMAEPAELGEPAGVARD
jgi:hypothetical protein